MAELKLTIDKFRLDEELVGQATQYYVWSKKVAEAQNAYDVAKGQLSYTAAELGSRVRASPDDFGLAGKPTKDMVDDTVVMQPEYQAYQRAVHSTYKELLEYKGAVEALDHRKRTLSLLVELWTREYYIDLQTKGIHSEEVAKVDTDPYGIRARKARKLARDEDRENNDDD